MEVGALPGTTGYLQADGECLYLAFRCEEPDMENTRADWLWSEGVEVFLDPLHDHDTFFHLGVTPDGTTGVGGRGPKHHAGMEVEFATSRAEGAWSVEMAIPFRTLGVTAPSPGDIWGILLCRSRRARFYSCPPLLKTYGFKVPGKWPHASFSVNAAGATDSGSTTDLCIPATRGGVSIDGELHPEEWEGAATVTEFGLLREPTRAEVADLIAHRYKEHGLTGAVGAAEIGRLKKLLSTHHWAREAYERIEAHADHWAAKSDDELYALIPTERPRAYCPSQSFGCPVCGAGVSHRSERALVTRVDTPNRWHCTTCNRWWGHGEEVEHETPRGPVRAVVTDDGSGWRVPAGFPGEGQTCYFVAAWRTFQLNLLVATDAARARAMKGAMLPQDALTSLATAYAVTGRRHYAHKALVILNRLAQLCPTYGGCVDHAGGSYINVITGGEEETIENVAYAYDLVFEQLAHDAELVDFFRRKGHEDFDGDGEVTAEDLRQNIAIQLFGYLYELTVRIRFSGANDWLIKYASLAALIGRALENPEMVKEALDGDCGLKQLMRKLYYNDGRFQYHSLTYAHHHPHCFVPLLRHVQGYCDGEVFRTPIDLTDEPSLICGRNIDYAYDLLCAGRVPGIGDGVVPREPVGPESQCSLAHAELVPHFPRLAQLIPDRADFVGRLVDELPGLQPREAIHRILLVSRLQESPQTSPQRREGSHLFTESGLAILRSPHGGHRQLHALLDYGPAGSTHWHHDLLSLNLIAFGHELTINKGYPYSHALNEKVEGWTKNTAAQNTVRVDGQNQPCYAVQLPLEETAGELHAYADNELFALADGSSERGYAPVVSHYRRAVFLIKNPQFPFVIDLFRVAGGEIRDYQFHAQADEEGQNFELRLADGAAPAPVCELPPDIDARFLYDLSEARTSGALRAQWRLGDEKGTGLILHMLPGAHSRHVIIGKGQAEGDDHPVPCDPHLIVREHGERPSLFLSVIVPYQGTEPQFCVRALESVDGPLSATATAMAVSFPDRTYVIFHDRDPKRENRFSDGQSLYRLRGAAGLLVEEGGSVRQASLVQGTIVGKNDVTFRGEMPKRGSIVAVHEDERRVVASSLDLPDRFPCLLKWRDRPWVYSVTHAERFDGHIALYLDTFSFRDRDGTPLLHEGEIVYYMQDGCRGCEDGS